MKVLPRFIRVFLIDAAGVLCIIAAPLTGWLPGPGGIPLLLLGLSLLSINHEWAKRYITLTKKYAGQLSKFVFFNHAGIQLAYDIAGMAAIGFSIYLFWLNNAFWQLSLGASLMFLGYTVLIGNRNRWQRIQQHFKRKR